MRISKNTTKKVSGKVSGILFAVIAISVLNVSALGLVQAASLGAYPYDGMMLADAASDRARQEEQRREQERQRHEEQRREQEQRRQDEQRQRQEEQRREQEQRRQEEQRQRAEDKRKEEAAIAEQKRKDEAAEKKSKEAANEQKHREEQAAEQRRRDAESRAEEQRRAMAAAARVEPRRPATEPGYNSSERNRGAVSNLSPVRSAPVAPEAPRSVAPAANISNSISNSATNAGAIAERNNRGLSPTGSIPSGVVTSIPLNRAAQPVAELPRTLAAPAANVTTAGGYVNRSGTGAAGLVPNPAYPAHSADHSQEQAHREETEQRHKEAELEAERQFRASLSASRPGAPRFQPAPVVPKAPVMVPVIEPIVRAPVSVAPATAAGGAKGGYGDLRYAGPNGQTGVPGSAGATDNAMMRAHQEEVQRRQEAEQQHQEAERQAEEQWRARTTSAKTPERRRQVTLEASRAPASQAGQIVPVANVAATNARNNDKTSNMPNWGVATGGPTPLTTNRGASVFTGAAAGVVAGGADGAANGAANNGVPGPKTRAERLAAEQTAKAAEKEAKQQAETEYLKAVAAGVKLVATKCPDGEGSYYATGSMHRIKPEVVSCIDVHFEAMCPDSRNVIAGVADNFIGMGGCFGDTYKITPKPACAVKDVKIRIVNAQACGSK